MRNIKSTAITALVMAVFWLLLAIGIYQHAAGNQPNVSVIIERPTTQQSFGPDIRHCFGDDETRTLWDCLRHKDFKHMRRTDI